MRRLRPISILAAVFAMNAYGYYNYGYSGYFPYRSQQPAPIISIDMDRQHQIDSAFRVAAREDRLNNMLQMLNDGANIDSVSDRGRSALMYAAQNCSVPIVKSLIAMKANVNVADDDGDTALVYATLESCLPVVKLLLREPKLDIKVRDHSGKNVFDYAKDCATLDVDGPASRIFQLLRRRAGRLALMP